jgi:type III pantothenate kinase
MSLLLTIDVGNTHISVGVFRDKTLAHTWRLHTKPRATADELGTQFLDWLHYATLDLNEVTGVAIASVVPSLDAALQEAASHYLHRMPLVIGPGTKLGIANLYKNPAEVGADRLVNAVAVHAFVGGPAIVVDFGTATTFDCISAKGEYLGGAIAPGLEIAYEGLAQHAAKLPRVNFAVPARVLGKTTKESLQSGFFFGYIGLVEGMLQRLSREMKGRPKIVATGGLSTVIGPRIKGISRIMPTLTLEGLRIIWERNQ